MSVIARLFSPMYHVLSALFYSLNILYSSCLACLACPSSFFPHLFILSCQSVIINTIVSILSKRMLSQSLNPHLFHHLYFNAHIIFSPYIIHSCPSFLINLLWFSLSAYMLCQFTLFYIYISYLVSVHLLSYLQSYSLSSLAYLFMSFLFLFSLTNTFYLLPCRWSCG